MPHPIAIALVVLALTGALASVLSALAAVIAVVAVLALWHAAIVAPIKNWLAEAERLAVARRRASLGYGAAPNLEQLRIGERRRALGYAK